MFFACMAHNQLQDEQKCQCLVFSASSCKVFFVNSCKRKYAQFIIRYLICSRNNRLIGKDYLIFAEGSVMTLGQKQALRIAFSSLLPVC